MEILKQETVSSPDDDGLASAAPPMAAAVVVPSSSLPPATRDNRTTARWSVVGGSLESTEAAVARRWWRERDEKCEKQEHCRRGGYGKEATPAEFVVVVVAEAVAEGARHSGTVEDFGHRDGGRSQI
uniref:DUF834 domain-containing protein n=1 Tax=Oryza nivara TaxID=4536 RepID=A0A0E0G5P6_ORYNI